MSTQTQASVPVDTFELRLAIARFHAGQMSAREAAEHVGVSGQTWRNWEAGASGGAKHPAMLRYIADRLGVDQHWLMWGGDLQKTECAVRDLNPQPADKETAAGLAKIVRIDRKTRHALLGDLSHELSPAS